MFHCRDHPQHLIIDITRLIRRLFMRGRLPTGIDRVSLAYVNHYGSTAHALIRWVGRCWILPQNESQAIFSWLLSPRSKMQVWRLIAQGILKNSYKQTNAGGIFLNIDHSGLEKASYPRMIDKLAVKSIFFVHDLIPITHPEYCRAGTDKRHQVRMNHVLTLASSVIVNSNATLMELKHFAQMNGRCVPPHVIAPLAPGFCIVAPGDRPIDKPYFVILSTIEPRKNHILLLHIWRDLVEQLGDNAPCLVMIGQRGWECDHVMNLFERCPAFKGVVTMLSTCSDKQLITYLHHAQAQLFPSFAEGYGLPLIEAISLGVPVIASDLPVFREIASDIPEYCSPLDGKGWMTLIIAYTQENSDLRGAQQSRMKGFNATHWANHFAKVDVLLAQIKERNRHD